MKISRYLVVGLALLCGACTTLGTDRQTLPDSTEHVSVRMTRETVGAPAIAAVAQYHCNPICRVLDVQTGFGPSSGQLVGNVVSSVGSAAVLGLSFPNPGNNYSQISVGNGTSVRGASATAAGGQAAGGTSNAAGGTSNSTAAGGTGGTSNAAATGGQGGRGGLSNSTSIAAGGQGGRGGNAEQQQGQFQGQEQTSGRPHLTYR